MLESIPYIDTHIHLWDTDVFPLDWVGALPDERQRLVTLGDLAATVPKQAPETVVAIQAEVPREQSLQEAEWLELQSTDTTRVAGSIAWAPLHEGSAAEALLEALSHLAGVRGIRQLLSTPESQVWLATSAFKAGLQLLPRHDFCFEINAPEHALGQVATLAEAVPEVTFAIDHTGMPRMRDLERPSPAWLEAMGRLAALPSVLCKISGLVEANRDGEHTLQRYRPWLDAAVETFGHDRISFASNWPVCEIATSYRTWLSIMLEWTADWNESDRQAFFTTNAKSFYRFRNTAIKEPQS